MGRRPACAKAEPQGRMACVITKKPSFFSTDCRMSYHRSHDSLHLDVREFAVSCVSLVSMGVSSEAYGQIICHVSQGVVNIGTGYSWGWGGGGFDHACHQL